jgi:hypothetical protein
MTLTKIVPPFSLSLHNLSSFAGCLATLTQNQADKKYK